MENVRRTEVDNIDEVTKVFNRIIDNQNMIEGKLLQMIADQRSVDAYNEKVDKYNESLLKG